MKILFSVVSFHFWMNDQSLAKIKKNSMRKNGNLKRSKEAKSKKNQSCPLPYQWFVVVNNEIKTKQK